MPEHSLILLVEDREDDILLIQRSFERAKIRTPLQIVSGGDEAIAYLSGIGKYSNRAEYPLPSLVLLDLKMPGMDGFEVLKWIRQQAGFGKLIVIVLTSSGDMKDINKAYALGANSFMVKPLEFQNAEALATMLEQYWIQHNLSPASHRSGQKVNGGKA